jgi:potassium efflux system protein
LDEDAGLPPLPAGLDALRADTADRLKRITASNIRGASTTESKAEKSEAPAVELRRGGSDSKQSSTSSKVSVLGAPSGAEAPAAGGVKPSAASRPGSQSLRDLLVERQDRLEVYEQARKELRALVEVQESPEQQAATARTEIERLEVQLAQAAMDLLPAVFKTKPAEITDNAQGEMKEAIESAKSKFKELESRFEAARAELASAGSQQNALRVERDKLFQRVATLKARSEERESAVAEAKSPEEMQLAQERLLNIRLEAAVEAIRLRSLEAKLDREARLADVRELKHHALDLHVQLSHKELEQMEARYRDLAEFQQRDLKRAAATEESKAQKSEDPLERYRARRLADLLELEARVIKNEQSLATSTHPSLEEQRSLADRAESDFAQIKQLLDDGKVSRMDALRLNNDFRRIGPERERLLRNELSAIEAQLQYYENTLTNVELELIEDATTDQAEHDTLLERLAAERHAQARTFFEELERKHKALLIRQRTALSKLVARASETLAQVTRRLKVLEDEYGFIRTHIFWVRDQEPIGLSTLKQSGREVKRLARALLKLGEEATMFKTWKQPSTEFLSATFAALILPLGLFRLRRVLRRRTTRALPPSHLHGEQVVTIRGEARSGGPQG